tara:strand:+ start:582 stop:755 length:174 start_codon:yes stop_codon:yes gene_type:complete
MLSEEGIQRLRGCIEERKEFIRKIRDLQKQLDEDEIDVYGFYEGVIAIKDYYESILH